MGVKIKSNDDRIRAAAIAVLLLARDRLSRGRTDALVGAALADFRDDYAGYKAAHPQRDLAAARDVSGLTDARLRRHYEQLLAAVERLLARIEKNGTQFSSLLELDNYLRQHLGTFD